MRNAHEVALEEVLARRAVPMVYQPVVHLESGEVVGFEALARPPRVAQATSSIVDLQDLAAATGRLGELDWICRTSALTDHGLNALPSSLSWFANAEPRAIDAPCPPDLLDRLEQLPRSVTEVTERAIAANPEGLLRGTRSIRQLGGRLAMDDVGVDPASLALLAVIAPEVVKLDIGLLDYLTVPDHARVVCAVRAYAERSGAAVLAEGIESPDQCEIAGALGATHGQGFLFGRPGELPTALPPPSEPLPRHRLLPDAGATTPFEVLAARRPVHRATKRLLLPMTRHLENQVNLRQEPLALLSTFEDPVMFDQGSRGRYQDFAARYAFVLVFGGGETASSLPKVHSGDIAPDDPLGREWSLVVLGPHYAAALAARDVGDYGPDDDRRFDYVVSHDRAMVEQAARALVARL